MPVSNGAYSNVEGSRVMPATNKANLIKFLAYGVIIVIVLSLPLFVKSPYKLHVFIMIAVSVILASSVRFIAITGLFSLAHGAMMAVGAYTSTLLVMKLGLSTWVAMLVGGLTAALIALLVGFPFTRLKGMYFALATVFLGEAISLILEQWRTITGGVAGIVNITTPNPIAIPGLLKIDFANKVDFYYLILIIMGICLVILYTLEHSRVGVTWSSVGQNDTLSESFGINTVGYQVLGFTIGCFFSGIAGAFYSQYITAITPDVFGFFWSVYIVVYMTVGGQRSFLGPIIGAFILTYIPESFRWLKAYQPFVFAGIMMVAIAFLPEGLVSIPSRVIQYAKRRTNHA